MTDRPYIQEMIMVHRVFRRESRLLPGLIRQVAPGDTARVRVVARMVHEYVSGLHKHHTGEDELLWPKLLARVDLDAELVLRMGQQHKTVDAGLAAVHEHLTAWESTASPSARDALAGAIEDHRRDLVVHLDEEEHSVLPLVWANITAAEWNELGARARAETPKNRLLFMLGALLEEATPDETAHMLAELPAPARLLWHVVGKRSYAREMRAVRAGAPAGQLLA